METTEGRETLHKLAGASLQSAPGRFRLVPLADFGFPKQRPPGTWVGSRLSANRPYRTTATEARLALRSKLMNTTRFDLLLASAFLISLGGTALAAAGPTSTLYVMNYGEFSGGNITGLDLIQGVSEASFPTSYDLDIDIAVYGDVRTMGYSTTNKGSQFDLAGNPLAGGPYINNIANSQLHDGTSDGSYNYSPNFSTGDIVQFDRNWANPTVLFNANANLTGAGYITMNAGDGSFWISQWGGPDTVAHFTHLGTLLGTFNSGVVGSTGLALDPVDGTLWMGDNNFVLHQFSQSGIPLQTIGYTLQGSWYGMEFDTTPVPEPSTLGLAVIGFVGLVAWGRRRRSR
jgi:hypothetical protein